MRRLINLRWRQARWALVAAVLPVLWACNTQPLHAPEAVPAATVKQYFLQKLNNQVDILFVVDNSPSMESMQTHLATQFPSFINVLKGLPNGLPDVHIGVVSTDVGTGQITNGVPGCTKQPYGDNGALQHLPGMEFTWNTTSSRWDAAQKTCSPPRDNFISASGGVNSEGVTNYEGTLDQVFNCIAPIGVKGCGFEHVFGGVVRALNADPWGVPGSVDNAGFLRDDAYLAIILITNEDDCTVPPDSLLFDPNSRNLSGPYGPLASYRCNAFGHLCDGQAPPMQPSDPRFGGGTSWIPSSCDANEDGTLMRVSDVVNAVKSVKSSADMIFVGALSGPATPYEVVLDATLPAASGATGEQWPKIQPSCTATTGAGAGGPPGGADPAVRIKKFVDEMGGVFESICAADFGVALQNIAGALGQRLGAQCLAGKLADKDLVTDGLQPDCQVIDRQPNGTGNWVESVLRQCDVRPADGTPTIDPCWYVDSDDKCTTAAKQVVKVYRSNPDAIPGGSNIAVGCVTCLEGTPGCDY